MISFYNSTISSLWTTSDLEIYPSKFSISLEWCPIILIISNDENKLVVSYEKSRISIDNIISELKKQDIKIFDISTDDGDLEDVFLRLTKS